MLEGPGDQELFALPQTESVPIITGILKLLQLRGLLVTIKVSWQGNGDPSLLPTGGGELYSANEPRSWIQWTMPSGIRVIIDHVKMKGRQNAYGVTNFAVEGSFDGVTWISIIRSETCNVQYQNWET